MLTGKIIVVTGGAGLLGSAFARAIAKQGSVVVIADIDVQAANSVAQDITSAHAGKAQAETLDITDKASVCSLIDRVNARYGRIDAVVNNAYPRNRNYGRKLEEVTYADFCENTNLHLGGYFLVAQQFSLFFRKQGDGNIVNMASIYGTLAPRFEIYADTPMTMPVEYAAIKSGVIQLTRYFAQYFKADQIRVNCLSPGGILDKQPESFLASYKAFCSAKGMLEPADLTGALLFLLSDGSRYMTGQNLVVDDGFTL
ncbi:MAG: flagellin modification protein A [Curvibacter sp. GWA2_64_110]|nr:MAG: flagellin modification protein A [Curvibacter sp. GWA2_64_110]HCY16758.1 flagellin modification protein A [Curvibacter sp.]